MEGRRVPESTLCPSQRAKRELRELRHVPWWDELRAPETVAETQRQVASKSGAWGERV